MSLADMIRKRMPAPIATAIPAISATQPVNTVGAVARIATIAVANSTGGQTEKAANGDTATVPMSASEEIAIRAWLEANETDPVLIAEIWSLCRNDTMVRAGYLRDACPATPDTDNDDDRRNCQQCINLNWVGKCLAANQLTTSPDYRPVQWQPRRCRCFGPKASDVDQRSAAERWQGL